MKKLFITLTTLFLLLTTFVACNKEEENPGIPFTKFSLSETSCRWVNMVITEEDFPFPSELIIINSVEELRNNITCDVTDGEYKLPVIDFSRYTLLLARGQRGAFRHIYIDVQQLSAQNYVVNLIQATTYFHAISEYWYVAILIDKLNEGDNVKLNVIHH